IWKKGTKVLRTRNPFAAMRMFLTWFAILILLTVAISFLVLQWQYRVWPEYLWARRLRRRMRELRERLDQIVHPPRNERSVAERLAAELFEQQTRAVGVEALDRFHGIGPKTVAWLKAAGIQTLAQAENHAQAFRFR